MRFLIWFLGTSLAWMPVSGSSVLYTTNTTTTNSSTPRITPSKTMSHPSSITSCTAASTSYIDIWDMFLNKTLLDWYNHSPVKYTSAINSIEGEIDTLASRYSMIQVNPWTIPTATWNAYEASIVKAISSYSSVEWGTAMDAVDTFAYSPWTDEPCLWTTCTNQLYSKSSAYALVSQTGAFEYTADPPCCTGCVIDAKAVKLAYWPTPAPTPGISTLVDASGTTYISPSVYAWFSKLNAWDGCSVVGPSTYMDTFLSFHPTDLRTSSASFNYWATALQWTRINYGDFGPQCTCTPPACPSDVLVGYQTNTCTPQLSMPDIATRLVPEWATCDVNFNGIFDLPYVLTVQPGLTTPKQNSATPTPPTKTPPVIGTSPQPVQTPSPSIPIITTQPFIATSLVNSESPISQAGATQTPNTSQSTLSPSNSSILSTSEKPLPSGGVTTTLAPSLVLNGQTFTADTQGFLVVGTSTLSADAQGNIVLAGQTVTAGASAMTVDGTIVSLGGAHTEIISGTSTTQLGSSISSTNSGIRSTSGTVEFTGCANLENKASVTMISVAVLLMSLTLIL